jgi:hypothetical protein
MSESTTPLTFFLMSAFCLELARVLRIAHFPMRVVFAGLHRPVRDVLALR